MIYTIKEGVYFGELQDRTHGGEPISWGFLFDANECTVALGNSAMKKKKATKKQLEDDVKLFIQKHIKDILDKYDRMNEVFNLQMSNDNRNRVLRADPRRARTFLAPHKGALLPDIYMKINTVDSEFSQVENLLTGEQDLFADPNLYLLNVKTVSPLVCYYVSGLLTTLDRVRLLQESARLENEKA
jgi:hypothetical protein